MIGRFGRLMDARFIDIASPNLVEFSCGGLAYEMMLY